jgi:hypothetical protein
MSDFEKELFVVQLKNPNAVKLDAFYVIPVAL